MVVQTNLSVTLYAYCLSCYVANNLHRLQTSNAGSSIQRGSRPVASLWRVVVSTICYINALYTLDDVEKLFFVSFYTLSEGWRLFAEPRRTAHTYEWVLISP